MYFKNDKKDFFLSFSKLFTEGILLTVGKLPFVNFWLTKGILSTDVIICW